MIAKEFTLFVNQGADFIYTQSAKNDDGTVFDLTGYTVVSKLSRSHTTPVVTAFTTSVPDAVNGVFKLSLTAIQTKAIPAGRYVYDAFFTNGTQTIKYSYGIVTVNPSVSV